MKRRVPKRARDVTRRLAKRARTYPYPSSSSGLYVLLRDGREVTRGTEGELWQWLHRHTSHSVDWALRYEGYKIEPS